MKNQNIEMKNQTPPTGAASAAVSEPLRRIQLMRKRGWRLPANTVVVSRPTKWGNPFRADPWYPAERAVADYTVWLETNGVQILRAAKVALRGKNLACWCKPGEPCHGDVLLRLVNT